MVYFFKGGETLLSFPFHSCLLPSFLFSLSTMDVVLEDWKKLSLTGVDGAKVSLKKSKNRNAKKYVLAAKFLTKRALNVEVIGRMFKPLWRSQNDFKVREADDHILLFVFDFDNDAERVLATEPWVFDKHLVLF